MFLSHSVVYPSNKSLSSRRRRAVIGNFFKFKWDTECATFCLILPGSHLAESIRLWQDVMATWISKKNPYPIVSFNCNKRWTFHALDNFLPIAQLTKCLTIWDNEIFKPCNSYTTKIHVLNFLNYGLKFLDLSLKIYLNVIQVKYNCH